MAESFDFNRIAKILCEDEAQHEANMKLFCVNSRIVELETFYDGYQSEVQRINAEIPLTKDLPTLEEFEDILKVFDEYPANMQKPRKAHHASKVTCNTNSSVLKPCSSTTLKEDHLIPIVESSDNLSSATGQLLPEAPSMTETYRNFKKFQQKLKELKVALADRSLSEEYKSKIRQFTIFLRELEKLLPAEVSVKQAFTAEEEETLQSIASQLEKLNYIQEHRNILQNAKVPNVNAVLDSLLEVLNYTLSSIRCFNEM